MKVLFNFNDKDGKQVKRAICLFRLICEAIREKVKISRVTKKKDYTEVDFKDIENEP